MITVALKPNLNNSGKDVESLFSISIPYFCQVWWQTVAELESHKILVYSSLDGLKRHYARNSGGLRNHYVASL